MNDCLFCKIIAGEIPSTKVYEDGIVNLSYYDTILGNDLCIYPSYYEPWGYTPLEATAFKVPCITTDLAGFGLWANTVVGKESTIEDGVEVIHRTEALKIMFPDKISRCLLHFFHI